MSASELDSGEIYERLDSEGLLGRIMALPEQIEEAWAAGRALELPASYAGCERVAVLGMGGSGIGGALLRALAVDIGVRTPVHTVRGYGSPGFIDERTLVLASSNSGNTEEVLSALGGALAAGAKCVAITTGGALGELARSRGLPALTFAWEGEQRSALGWSFASLLAICASAGLLPDLGDDVRGAVAEMQDGRGPLGAEAPEASNAAKQLARRLHGRLPVFVGAQALAPVAYRWRTQVNENAKSWAVADELPEMNHNAHAGYGLPAEVVGRLQVVLLRHASMHPRVRLRVDATAASMGAAGVAADVVDVAGGSVLAQMLRAVQLGDFVSYYLGLLNGVRPSPVVALEKLKRALSREP
ncbi:MAG: bifunctional phosphoglucose/phosphomannose isomerase [Dehalococcoidia bacterium]